MDEQLLGARVLDSARRSSSGRSLKNGQTMRGPAE